MFFVSLPNLCWESFFSASIPVRPVASEEAPSERMKAGYIDSRFRIARAWRETSKPGVRKPERETARKNSSVGNRSKRTKAERPKRATETAAPTTNHRLIARWLSDL